ncbi:MAG: hypothetical protein RDV48_31375 [Candidatus Eremiobacteraeota bacterium]|nr:hypothetical protein [Candidatus Eremiobacteraeota bacterium]
MQIEPSTQQAELARARETLRKGMPELYQAKQKAQANVDRFDKELQAAEQESAKAKEMADFAKKKLVQYKALTWATIGLGAAVTAAVAFLCLPAITIPALGTTFAACHFYKKKEAADGLAFHSEHGFSDIKQQMIGLQKQMALEELKKTDGKITQMEGKIAEVEKMARLAGNIEPGENAGQGAGQKVVEEDDIVDIGGVKLQKS